MGREPKLRATSTDRVRVGTSPGEHSPGQALVVPPGPGKRNRSWSGQRHPRLGGTQLLGGGPLVPPTEAPPRAQTAAKHGDWRPGGRQLRTAWPRPVGTHSDTSVPAMPPPRATGGGCGSSTGGPSHLPCLWVSISPRHTQEAKAEQGRAAEARGRAAEHRARAGAGRKPGAVRQTPQLRGISSPAPARPGPASQQKQKHNRSQKNKHGKHTQK